MKIGIIGGGTVGQTLATGFLGKGHEVVIGIREVTDAELRKNRNGARPLADWQSGSGGRVVTMTEAAAFGDVVVNATSGLASLQALARAHPADLTGKVLIDVANPLDFSKGMPPFLAHAYTGDTSLAEQIQNRFPEARVVKAFNTVAANAMVDAAFVPGEHDLLIAGNDPAAKDLVTALARGFGWANIADMGDLVGARAMEGLLPLWIRMWILANDPRVNIHLVRAA
ncbi:MAG: NAD(P)-binding domain-containing protein [Tabrizicola sp.]|nr:NAD(P)-binding domain-containing protein [Tabrizicola sp.]